MRQVRYAVAASLDGYIAGPSGENDWIPMDPEIDFAVIFARYDTLLLGRRSFETMAGQKDESGGFFDKKCYVVSTTLDAAAHPGVTVVSENVGDVVRDLREQDGQDIWLFGGGVLFKSLLDLGLVDGVEVAVIPVLLGRGIPLLPDRDGLAQLRLTGHRVYADTGTVLLEYAIK